MSLPIHSPLTAPRPTTLAQAVAQARHPRNHATAQLEPHREELLRLAQAGDSAETLAAGLRLIGIGIGRETMRRWLRRELGSKKAKRRKARTLAPRAIPTAAVESIVMPEPSAPREVPLPAPVQSSNLILSGETPSQALQRRLAAMNTEKASFPRSPQIARDDL